MDTQMHRHEDRGAGGGGCSLNVSVTSRCQDASCRDVVPTFESAGQQKWKKETEIREKGLMRKRQQKEQKYV